MICKKTKKEAVEEINYLTNKGFPYFFVADFEGDNFLIISGNEVFNGKDLFFDFGGVTNYRRELKAKIRIVNIQPPTFEEYCKAFEQVKRQISYGNTYLLNLTFASEIQFDTSCYNLEKIFLAAKSKYKVWLPDKFVCFSPETFVKIDSDGIISTYPMKGTADARLPDALHKLLKNEKEISEHFTIVDLLRNDLAQVANYVKVKRFRYYEKIISSRGELWQTSSEIVGKLKPDFIKNYGNVLSEMLPAGSISGAPKKKTVEIIKNVEPVSRGFYTGIAGFFNGEELDTTVLIRFIEKKNNRFFYRSGGGIVFKSVAKKEYEELIKKIYLPV